MAESNPSNVARFIDCTTGSSLCVKLLNELTGTNVKTDEKSILWNVDNKYYSASINLLIDNSSEGNNCDAIVFLYSTQEVDSFLKVKQLWGTISEESTPSVCLILGACSGNEGEEAFDEVLKWCVENEFELVEWNYENETNDDDSLDKNGVARVTDALQAHMWPDIIMKDGKDNKVTSNNTSTNNVEDDNKQLTVEQILSRGLSNHGDPTDDVTSITGQESFEELFGRFAGMKTHAESLPSEERKDYAEKVVKAFWQAIGGDDEELSDSD